MELVLPFLKFTLLMAAAVVALRLFVRRPRNVSHVDSPGIRSVVIFSGNDPEFFRDDGPQEPYVGIRLFQMLCDGLAAEGIMIANRRNVQNAQGADCVVDGDRFGLVLEYLDPDWVAGVDWAPTSAAERRHMALTYQVFAPHDSRGLRRLLEGMDRWLKRHPALSDIRWIRKEAWLAEDVSDASERPTA